MGLGLKITYECATCHATVTTAGFSVKEFVCISCGGRKSIFKKYETSQPVIETASIKPSEIRDKGS